MKLFDLLRWAILDPDHTLIVREPSVSFSVPGIGTFGIIKMEISYWVHLIKVTAACDAIGFLFAMIIYCFIIQKKGGSNLSFFIGYGFVIPTLTILVPFRLMDLFQTRNANYSFNIGSACGGAMSFRCIAAMHGTVPKYATKDMHSFIQYYLTPQMIQFDPKTNNPIKMTPQKFLIKMLKFIQSYFIMSLLFSILIPCSYKPFSSRKGSIDNSFINLFYWGNILNNYIMATLIASYLSMVSSAISVHVGLKNGLSTKEIMDQPLLKSKSVSEFWGRRWNSMTQDYLKIGIYKPMLQHHYSKLTSSMVTFIASGILHEYLLFTMATQPYKRQKPFVPNFGFHLAFFTWNGLLLLAEVVLRRNSTLPKAFEILPSPIKSAIVIMMVLPIAHLFLDDFGRSGFYEDLAIAFPQIVYLESSIGYESAG